MLIRYIAVNGTEYPVAISNDSEALSAAYTAGRAIVGFCPYGEPMSLFPAEYVVEAESPEEITDEYLERVVRRKLKLPWIISETDRIIIREWHIKDIPHIPKEDEDTESDTIFQHEDTMEAYISEQYRFYEYGIWAIVSKSDEKIIGAAGISNLELECGEIVQEIGYHIFVPWRRKGYAYEACSQIIKYAASELEIKKLYARINRSNTASVKLAEKLGFKLQKDNGETLWSCQCY